MIDGFLFVLYYQRMNKIRSKHIALTLASVLVLLLVLTACGPAAPTPDAATDEPVTQPTPTQAGGAEDPTDSEEGVEGEEAYPPPQPTAAVADGPYPPPTNAVPTAASAYPEPESTPEGGVEFAFERPVNVGDTVIRGTGPAGLEVKIINVTFMGEEIASTVIGEDGLFEVEVPALEGGVRIGLTADIEGSDLEQQIVPGEGAINVPQVGYYFDSIVLSDNG